MSNGLPLHEVARLHRAASLPLLIGCRSICDGDENHLLTAERMSITTRPEASRRNSGAARAIAHDLLREMGAADIAILRGDRGAPVWPQGYVGSLAHDETVAVAAVARSRDLRSVGIDIEPAEPLPPELTEIVTMPADVLASPDDVASRVLFCAKEAVFKAVYPLDGRVLGFDEVMVDLERGLAWTPGREGIRVMTQTGGHIVALACIA